jgi:hypothetical protein
MGQTFGAGLLTKLPADAVDTEEKQRAVLTSFFNTGVVLDLYELVDGRVARIHGHLDAPTWEWVTDEAKVAEVQQVMRLGGSRPSSYFAFLDGFQLFVPDEEAHGPPITLPLPDGRPFEFTYHNMVTGLKRLRQINQRLTQRPDSFFESMAHTRAEYIEFHEQLIADIEACQRAEVVYSL